MEGRRQNREKELRTILRRRKKKRTGTSFMVDEKLQEKVIQFKLMAARLSCIRTGNKQTNASEEANDDEKINLKKKLKETNNTIPKNDILVVKKIKILRENRPNKVRLEAMEQNCAIWLLQRTNIL